jgi:hypothetical protein
VLPVLAIAPLAGVGAAALAGRFHPWPVTIAACSAELLAYALVLSVNVRQTRARMERAGGAEFLAALPSRSVGRRLGVVGALLALAAAIAGLVLIVASLLQSSAAR